MDFEQIRVFLNVASLKSFSAAAEKMFISQPSVSVRIKALEEELGVVLFERSKAREPVLTEAGRLFLNYAQSFINLQNQCKESLSGQREEMTGMVYIGASTVPGTYILPLLFADFKGACPAIDFSIEILDTSAVLEGILNYSFDLGFVGLLREDDRLAYLPLVDDELLFCTPKGLLKSKEHSDIIGLGSCTGLHLLMREKGSATRKLLEKALIKNNFSFDMFSGVTYFNSMEGIKEAVRHGLGVAFLSRLSVQDMAEGSKIDCYRVKELDLSRSLYLVSHRNRVLGKAAENLKDFTAEYFQGGDNNGQS